MNIYVVRDARGFLRVIWGSYLRAVKVSVGGDIRRCDASEVDDVVYGRLPFENLPKF